MSALRFGVIGAGRHGSRYIKHILEDVKGAELAAVCRMDPSKGLGLEIEPDKVSLHGDYRKLLEDDLDVVVIATPTALHEEMAAASMEAGVDVVLEKPMAATSEACRRLIDVEKRTGRKLMIAQTLRYCPVWKKMGKIWKELPFPEWFEMVQYLEPPKTPWLLDRELAGGGCLLNTGVHVFDSLRFIFDADITSVECRTERSLNPVWEDFAYGTIKLKGGLEGSFKIARDSKYRSRTMRIDHEGGVLYGDALNVKLMKLEDGVEKLVPLRGEVKMLVPLLKDMVRCVRTGKEPPITSGDGLRAVEIAEACYRSAERGTEVLL
ncbi:MAG: Gfo/Idh/MocA family protein [Thermoplasmatota archaeon]